MITADLGTTLTALEYVADRVIAEDCILYRELTGKPFEPSRVATQLALMALPGLVWTFYEWSPGPATPVAVGGFTPVRPGVLQTWFMHNPGAWARGHDISELVAQCYFDAFKDQTVRRIETVTLASRTRARAWYEHLGLTCESTACKASASGADLVTYVALRP